MSITSKQRKIIAIVGPTASGKTGIGVKLAREFNGEIISADSRQVYRGLDLGTGKEGGTYYQSILPALAGGGILTSSGEAGTPQAVRGSEEPSGSRRDDELMKYRQSLRYIDEIPQWLIDIAEPEERFVLFDWLKLARLAIEDIFSRGKVPIVVGGTGLYVQALAEGFGLVQNMNVISSHPEPPTGICGPTVGWIEGGEKSRRIRDDGIPRLHNRIARDDNQNKDMNIQQLRMRLERLDPSAYQKIDLNNPHRLIRAIERAQEGLVPTKKTPDFEVLQIGLDLPRIELYQRIDERVESRFEAGMLEEAIGLIKNGVDINWLLRLGLEYRIMTEFVIYNFQFLVSNQIPNSNDQILKRFDAGISLEIRNSKLDIQTITELLSLLPEYVNMKQTLKYRIHAFARRQLTWFRRFPEIKWCQNYSEVSVEVKTKFDN